MKGSKANTLNQPEPKPLTIADVFEDVFVSPNFGDVPPWPPDVFCFAAAVLHQSGAYTRVSSNLELGKDFSSAQAREREIEEIAEKWKNQWTSPDQVPSRVVKVKAPAQVVKWWNVVKKTRNISLKELSSNNNDFVTAALINLVAVADQACLGVGTPVSGRDQAFLRKADRALLTSANRTLCKNIAPARYAVLPKMHTAQSGLTIRSFSHNLALLHSREMEARWVFPYTPSNLFKNSANQHAFNLLLVP